MRGHIKEIQIKQREYVKKFLFSKFSILEVEIQYVLEGEDGKEWTGSINKQKIYQKKDGKYGAFIKQLDDVRGIKKGDMVEIQFDDSKEEIFPIFKVQ